MEQLTRLVCEVERVVTAPYVPSLQGLYHLLQESDSLSIESWAYCKPCQAGLLADVLVEAIPRSRVALPLISMFASTLTVRDAILERHPIILDAFMEKAVNDESEYNSACIAFFSSALPKGFVPPARIATFVSKLVSAMVANPCAETVAPIYALINALKDLPRFLDDIPSEVMSNLQLELTKMLRNLDDHLGNLRCLAIFAHIATAQSTRTRYQHGSESQWLLSIRHFFGPKRGIKTLDLVVLRVILACSTSCTLGPQDAIESIRLAITIADAIEPEQKQAWISSNSAKISKLCEKVVRDGLYDGIKKMAILFLYALLPVQSLSSQLRMLGLKTLLSESSQDTLELMSPNLVKRLAKSLAATGESATREAITFVFGALKSSQGQGRDAITATRLANLILAGLREVHHETISFNLQSSMGVLRKVLTESVEHFPRQQNENQCQGSIVCTSQLCTMQNQLFISLLGAYSRASLPHNTGDLTMEYLLKRVEHSLPDSRCEFSITRPENVQGCLVLSNNGRLSSTYANRNWRAGITNEFMKNAQACHDSMMRKIEDTCFDLERRCEGVEEPLRVVEEERDRYAQENEQLKEQNTRLNEELKQNTEELEATRRRSSETLTEFGHEHTRLEQLLHDQYSHREELMSSIAALQTKLEEQQQDYEHNVATERERARSKETEMVATLTEKDGQIDELLKEADNIKSLHEQTCQSLAQVSKENTNYQKTSGSLKLELASATQSLEEVRLNNAKKDKEISDLLRLNSQQEDKISRLMIQEEDLRKGMWSLEASAERKAAEYERLHSSLRKSEEELWSKIERLKHEAEAESSRASNEITKRNEENQQLRAMMQAAALEASNETHLNKKRIQHLERKVQALRNERAAKAREFSEAQQHIGRLMGVMGFSANASESTPKHERTKPSTHQTPAARSPLQISDDEDENQSHHSRHISIGPTPKHPRGNHHSAAGYPVKFQKSPPTTTSSARKSLEETSCNSPSRTPSSTESKDSPIENSKGPRAGEDSDHNRLQNMDLDMDVELSKEFLFSSTEFTGSGEQIDTQ